MLYFRAKYLFAMKKIIVLLSISLFLACSDTDHKLDRNPFLPNPVVNMDLNLNLPEYNPLKYPGSYVIVSQGIKGIVVYCVSETQYWAFDLSDPNHVPNNCSRMELDGIIAKCTCPDDTNEYNIVNFGQHRTEPDVKYPMQQYRTERSGNYVRIFN